MKQKLLQHCQHNAGDISRFQISVPGPGPPRSAQPQFGSACLSVSASLSVRSVCYQKCKNYHQRTSGLYLSQQPPLLHFPPPPSHVGNLLPLCNMQKAKYFPCVSADFEHEVCFWAGVENWLVFCVGGRSSREQRRNLKCDYLRLPICSLSSVRGAATGLVAAPGRCMLIDF